MDTFKLDASPSEARWYVEIIIGRKVEIVRRYGDDYKRPADVPTETSYIDGYTTQSDRPSIKQLNELIPDGWTRLESHVTPTGQGA